MAERRHGLDRLADVAQVVQHLAGHHEVVLAALGRRPRQRGDLADAETRRRQAFAGALDGAVADVQAVELVAQLGQVLALVAFAAADLEQRADTAGVRGDHRVGLREARLLACRRHAPRVGQRVELVQPGVVVVGADAAHRVAAPHLRDDLAGRRAFGGDQVEQASAGHRTFLCRSEKWGASCAP
ncbi:MAG: hypothetical protein QM722_10830 [Piscinibacter sp.]